MLTRRLRYPLLLIALALPQTTSAGDVYATAFENFTAGTDKIIGTDGWTGTQQGLGIHGILTEFQHQVLGLGKSAFMGGNPAAFSGASNVVSVRRPVNINPVSLGREVVTFSVNLGVKDSTADAAFRRDDFSFLIVNSDASPRILGGVQFDNSTLDAGEPRRIIWRTLWNAGVMQYTNTGTSFFHDTIEPLAIRVNFRTNLWTAYFGGVPLFQDVPFYGGTAPLTLGTVHVRLETRNRQPFTNYQWPGDNYMLFDDYIIRAEPVATRLTAGTATDGAARLSWTEEAGYSYRLQWSADCAGWQDFSDTIHTAILTGTSEFTDPASPRPAKRFYRVMRTFP
ncbi:MAG: hypothetical protein MUF04_06220 [Akkermansiaceae bacterium]|nr:hypothetical protein [Akkermansiaceae bacterium]